MSKVKQPALTRKQIEDLIAPYLKELPVEKYPMVAFGIRGLYGVNKRGEWDDGNGFIERTENGAYAIFPGNTDPTAPYRKGLGCLSSGQILWFKIGLHKGRKAFRQAATFLVDRDGVGKHLKAPISCAFNWHDSLSSGTSSLGCQTNPKDVFPAVRELGYMLARKYYKNETFPYILVDSNVVAEIRTSLKKGDRGDKVKFIQLYLGIKDDGIFGLNTEKAVIAFQKKHGLVADGVVGPKTAAMMATPVGEKPAKKAAYSPSAECIDLIKSFEGYYSKAYLCPANVMTIGYGTTVYPNGKKVKKGDTCTKEQAELWLIYEVSEKAKAVQKALKFPVLQGQFDALVSFAYNVGTGAFQKSTMLKKLNAGDIQGAANEFLKWNKGGGKVLKGLVRRREAEKKLFLKA